MSQDHQDAPPGKLWAYAYQIEPPQPEHRLRAIRKLIEREHLDAKARARTWEGRFVEEEQVTHILVVSDSPEQDSAANHRLEAALTELQAGFAITAPLAVAGPEVAPVDRPAGAMTGP